MNKQTFKLLEYIIINEGKPITINELATHFNVSSRSFYNYWEEIFDFLTEIHSPLLVVFNNHEFWFNGSVDESNFLKISMSSLSFYEYRLSSEERRNLILIMLAISDVPIKSVYFENILCVSRNTIITDLKNVRKYVKQYDISISDNKHNGTSIIANENKRREIILSCLEHLDVDDAFLPNSIKSPCVAFLNQYLKFDKYRNVAEKAVLRTEDELLIKLPDHHFYQFVFILILFIQRIESGHLITGKEEPIIENEELSIFIIKIFTFLGKDFEKMNNEINYFIQFLSTKNIASHIVKSKDNPRYISTLIRDMLYDIQPNYKLNLVDDQILNEFLISHINLCYHRMYAGRKADNPFLSNIRTQYSNDFERLKESIYILENGLNISLSDNEIAYILMHILASVERNTAQKNVLNVLVACSAGIATGNLLSALVKKNFNVNIVATVSTHDIESILKENKIDLIISNVPIENATVPSVTVNAILSDKDIAKIHSQIIIENSKNNLKSNDKIADDFKDTKHMNITFLDLLSKNTIDLCGEATNWQEAIIVAGEILLWNNNITANYIHEMIKLVEKFGPYILVAPGVAIAHAQPDNGIIKPGVSIVYFKKPIVFGKKEFDPVEVVVACAINDTQEYINALLQLMTVLRKPGFVQFIRKAKKPDDIIHYLEGLCINILNKKLVIDSSNE